MMLPLVLLLEYGHSVAGIVGELIRVAGVERLAMAEILAKLVGSRAQQGGVLPVLQGVLFHRTSICNFIVHFLNNSAS